ncbi:MAG: DUF1844 domain-containing protein [Acidobacteria bacterium]|nr:DUF1844 domain-containing protein [Acidobacteriota bacterium]
MADENQTGFKVTDRRLFNADGTLREDALIEQSTASVAPAELQSAVTPTPAQPAPEAPSTDYFPDEDPNALPEQTMFTEFLMGVASSAFIYLGMVEHPATGRRQIDLGAAKESIDMLKMLREKTKGNLTRGEEKFFDDLLADLRMQFVSIRRQ